VPTAQLGFLEELVPKTPLSELRNVTITEPHYVVEGMRAKLVGTRAALEDIERVKMTVCAVSTAEPDTLHAVLLFCVNAANGIVARLDFEP
jgi:hypothetical protein